MYQYLCIYTIYVWKVSGSPGVKEQILLNMGPEQCQKIPIDQAWFGGHITCLMLRTSVSWWIRPYDCWFWKKYIQTYMQYDIYIYIFIYIYTHKYMHIYIYKKTYIQIYIYIYTHTHMISVSGWRRGRHSLLLICSVRSFGSRSVRPGRVPHVHLSLGDTSQPMLGSNSNLWRSTARELVSQWEAEKNCDFGFWER